jgi:glycosyltransferase involved in cell wall biosynthesis
MLKGLSSDSYCMVSLPLYPEKQDNVSYTPALQGRRYLLQPESQMFALSFFSKLANKSSAILNLGFLAFQRGVNIAIALKDDNTDTLVGCSGDLLDLPATWVASRILGRRFIVYFFDDYREQWWADPLSKTFASRVERYLVARASKIFVTNEYMRAEIAQRYGLPSYIIRNPGPSKLLNKLDKFPSRDGEVRLVFTGAVYHLNYDILRSILAALELLSDDILYRLHVYTAQSSEQLEAEGISGGHVVIHGHVTPDDAARIQSEADIQLIPFSPVPEAVGIVRTAATAKLADYLASGRPILALCPDNSFLAWFLREHQCGLSLDSGQPEDIANAIDKIVSQPELRHDMQNNARRLAKSEFSPDASQARLIELLGLHIPPLAKSKKPLKVVQISAGDLIGQQVNGFMMHKWLQEMGHESYMLVNDRQSGDMHVRALGSTIARNVNSWTVKQEVKLNSIAMLPVLSHRIDKDPWIHDADIINLQLIHAAPFFSLLDLARLSRRKRVILSVHDMFFLTGRCIYSMGCELWKTGCGCCPDLSYPFQLSRDTSARNWKLKRWAFNRCKRIDIVVGSPWQEERVSQSPILSRFPRHMIPYGVDSRAFKPADKNQIRHELGIPVDADVIAFRSAPFHKNYKGTEYIHEALRQYKPRKKTVLVIFESIGGMSDLYEKYEFHEMGWINDTNMKQKHLA